MTKSSIAAAGILLALASCSTPTDRYTVTGNIAGIPDGTELYLILRSHINRDTVATTTINGGNFTFEGQAPEPRLVSLLVKDAYGSYPFMLENAQIELSGTANESADENGKKSYDFDGIAISGSPATDTFHAKNARRERLDSAFAAHYELYQPLMNRINEARNSADNIALDSLTNTEECRKMNEEEKLLFEGLQEAFDETVAANKDSFWGPLMMIVQTTYLNAENRELFDSFSDEAKNSYYGREVYEELYPIGKIGDKLQDFTAKTIKGDEISFSGFCKGKKLVLLDFWASWCRPCRAEIPNLKKIYADFADKGFDIVSISIDKEDGPWQKAVEAEGLEWTNIRDTDESISGKYKVSAVPTMYLVDADGCLVGENLRGEALAAKVKDILN